MFMTLTDTCLLLSLNVTLISETQILSCQLPVTISRKNKERKLVRAISAEYIIVCYFFLIIFSTV